MALPALIGIGGISFVMGEQLNGGMIVMLVLSLFLMFYHLFKTRTVY